MGNAAKRPSVWRRAQVSDLRLRRARGVRLAALAGVSGVLLLPPATSAHAVLLDDTTPPIVAYSIDGIVGTNGWYRGNAAGNFVVVQLVGERSRVDDHLDHRLRAGIQSPRPDPGRYEARARPRAPEAPPPFTTKAISIDATPPAVTAAAGARRRLERLVQQAGRRLVLRNRRDLRRGELFRIDLRRPRQRERTGVRHLHRRRRQRRQRHARDSPTTRPRRSCSSSAPSPPSAASSSTGRPPPTRSGCR